MARHVLQAHHGQVQARGKTQSTEKARPASSKMLWMRLQACTLLLWIDGGYDAVEQADVQQIDGSAKSVCDGRKQIVSIYRIAVVERVLGGGFIGLQAGAHANEALLCVPQLALNANACILWRPSIHAIRGFGQDACSARTG